MQGLTGHIRSFVLRQGRITPHQRNCLEKYWPHYGIDFQDCLLELDECFGRRAPKILDIGTGSGDSTISLALAHPENDYLAVEVHTPGVGSLLGKIVDHGLGNVRVIQHDVIDILKHMLPKQSLDAVYLFFPDPWPKKRHHKRRLMNENFLDLLGPRLHRHGRLFVATDWHDYAEHIHDLLLQLPCYINLAGTGGFTPRPYWRITTRFEERGRRLDHRVTDFVLGYRSVQEKHP